MHRGSSLSSAVNNIVPSLVASITDVACRWHTSLFTLCDVVPWLIATVTQVPGRGYSPFLSTPSTASPSVPLCLHRLFIQSGTSKATNASLEHFTNTTVQRAVTYSLTACCDNTVSRDGSGMQPALLAHTSTSSSMIVHTITYYT
jgi:hypothetical protein